MKRDERGQSLVEFAVLVPVLVLLLFGIVEFGISLYQYQQESNAVGIAARLLSSSRGQTSDPCALVAQAIEGPTENGVGGAAPGLTPASLTLTLTLNGTQYSGTSCTAAASQMVYLSSAQVQATYPCNLSVISISGCTLTAKTSEVVQ